MNVSEVKTSSSPTGGAGGGCTEEEDVAQVSGRRQLQDLLGSAPFCLQEVLNLQTETLHGFHCLRVLKRTVESVSKQKDEMKQKFTVFPS